MKLAWVGGPVVGREDSSPDQPRARTMVGRCAIGLTLLWMQAMGTLHRLGGGRGATNLARGQLHTRVAQAKACVLVEGPRSIAQLFAREHGEGLAGAGEARGGCV